MVINTTMLYTLVKYYSHTQARAKLPKKRRRVVNIELPQAAQNKARGRGAAGRAGGKAALGQKMGKLMFFVY